MSILGGILGAPCEYILGIQHVFCCHSAGYARIDLESLIPNNKFSVCVNEVTFPIRATNYT